MALEVCRLLRNNELTTTISNENNYKHSCITRNGSQENKNHAGRKKYNLRSHNSNGRKIVEYSLGAWKTYLRGHPNIGRCQAGTLLLVVGAQGGQMLEQLPVLLQQLLGARLLKDIIWFYDMKDIALKDSYLRLNARISLRDELLPHQHQLA